MATTKCDICSSDSVKHAHDEIGRRYDACSEHVPCLAGWVRDANSEMVSESAAAARFEDAAYGRDYDY